MADVYLHGLCLSSRTHRHSHLSHILRLLPPCRLSSDPVYSPLRRTQLTELTPELLWTFIERIDIGERPGRYNRNGMQEVRIIYRDVGVVDSTLSAEDAESTEVHFIPSLEMVVQQMAAQTQVS